MERLTNDNPNGNFDVTLNYVFNKDGWAHIRSDGENEGPVPLTEWVRRQCSARGCDEPPMDPEGTDQYITECAFSAPSCPVFLAYTFAAQACHLRDRLKQIEDILGDKYDLGHLRELVEAEKAGRLIILPEPRKRAIVRCNGRCYSDLTAEEISSLLEAWDAGRLAVLPVNLGQDVWILLKDALCFHPDTNGWYLSEETIKAVSVNGFSVDILDTEAWFIPFEQIGKTVFLTRETAEAALEAQKGGEG